MRSRREEPAPIENKVREWTTERVVYLGLRERRTGISSTSHLLVFTKLVIGDDATLSDDTVMYTDKSPGTSRSIAKGFIVGGIYAMEFSGDSARVQAAKYLRLYHDESSRAEWLALDRATRGAIEVERSMAGLARQRADLECLEPLRAAYERMTARQRAAYIARIVQYMMTGH